MQGVKIYKPQCQQPLEENIGALWRRYDKNNRIYFCGRVTVNNESVKIVIFENPIRKSEAHPLFIIKKNKQQ
jgi:hypothetical protein